LLTVLKDKILRWATIDTASALQNFIKELDQVIENAGRAVGVWGGTCTCPNGGVYLVGDNQDSCGSLACIGGTKGTCNRYSGDWARRKVICAPVHTTRIPENPSLESGSVDEDEIISAVSVEAEEEIFFVDINDMTTLILGGACLFFIGTTILFCTLYFQMCPCQKESDSVEFEHEPPKIIIAAASFDVSQDEGTSYNLTHTNWTGLKPGSPPSPSSRPLPPIPRKIAVNTSINSVASSTDLSGLWRTF